VSFLCVFSLTFEEEESRSVPNEVQNSQPAMRKCDHIRETAGRHHLQKKRKTTRLDNKRRNLGGLRGNWQTTSGKPHLGDIWETIVTQLGDNWVTIGTQLEDIRETAGRQAGDHMWETNGSCGRQVENHQETIGWEKTSGKPHHLDDK
jgi:hypothetical protein